MGISYEPTLGQTLGPEIEQLATAIKHRLNPNADFQLLMRNRLATEPELAQHLADVEAQAPGTLAALGFGPLTNVIKGIPESQSAEFARTNRGEISKVQKQKLGEEDVSSQVGTEQLKGALDILTQGGPNAVDAFRKKLGLGSVAQQRTEEATATSKEAEAANAGQFFSSEALIKDQEAQKGQKELNFLNQQDQAMQQLLAKYPDLKGIDFMGIARSIGSGQKAPSDFGAIMMNPVTRQAFDVAKSMYEMQENRNMRLELQAERLQNSPQNQDIKTAYQLYRSSRGVGSPKAWLDLEKNPAAADGLLTKDPNTLNQTQKDLVAVARKKIDDANKDQMQERIKQLSLSRSAETGTRVAIAAFKKGNGSNADVQSAVANLQATMPEGYGVRFGPPPDIGSDKPGSKFLGMGTASPELYYVGPDGKRVKDDTPFSLTPTTPTVTPQGKARQTTSNPQAKLSATGLRALTQIKAGKGTIDDLRKVNPQLADEVSPYLTKK